MKNQDSVTLSKVISELKKISDQLKSISNNEKEYSNNFYRDSFDFMVGENIRLYKLLRRKSDDRSSVVRKVA
jgi:flagellar biosynthesis chaperone FliJ